ncbi:MULTISPECIES: phage integrase [unclassified Endozoicomonas]|uniref:phage integrase n=1 Tax=unclassified Endozoicomonas TaxID=2644528 RepID=UPI003BB79A3F
MKITKNPKTGKWKLDVEITKGKRYRKTCNTKAECLEYYHQIKWKHADREDYDRQDNRSLKTIINLWYEGRGCELVKGDRIRRVLHSMADVLGNPEARRMTPKRFNDYKAIRRIKSQQDNKGIADSTLNNYLTYLRSVYNYLIAIGEINYPNPLAQAHKIKVQEPELAYLTSDQIDCLLAVIKQNFKGNHLLLVTKLCLATGARWSEITSRKVHHFKNQQIDLTKTKGKRIRSIPLDEDIYEAAKQHLEQHGSFKCTRRGFAKAVKLAGISLPEGQNSHVLRHTFASHFMMNKGNIIVLQNILGHTDIKLTMKYAKFDPEHFKDAINLNPLAQLERQ